MSLASPYWEDWDCVEINAADMIPASRWCERLMNGHNRFYWSSLHKSRPMYHADGSKPVFFYFENSEDSIAFRLAIGT